MILYPYRVLGRCAKFLLCSSLGEAGSTGGVPELLIGFIRRMKTEGDPFNMLENYEELQKMYEEGGLVGALEGETLVFRRGKLIARLPRGESFVIEANNESRIPYMHWIV